MIQSSKPLQAKSMSLDSAGVSALYGRPATAEARAVMAEQGLSLQGHSSKPLTENLIKSIDLILTMTEE